jgi:hypothetical protein
MQDVFADNRFKKEDKLLSMSSIGTINVDTESEDSESDERS